MTRYVIGPDVAVRLAREEAVIRGVHQLLAPALLRSQVLSLVYQAVRRGEMTSKQAERQLEYVRGLRMQPLGDHVLQDVAWKAAGLLGWADTSDAEYVALTQLQLTCLRAWVEPDHGEWHRRRRRARCLYAAETRSPTRILPSVRMSAFSPPRWMRSLMIPGAPRWNRY